MLALYVKTMTALQSMKKEEEGQDLIEYALLGALISVACIASMQGVATAIRGVFTTISGAL